MLNVDVVQVNWFSPALRGGGGGGAVWCCVVLLVVLCVVWVVREVKEVKEAFELGCPIVLLSYCLKKCKMFHSLAVPMSQIP